MFSSCYAIPVRLRRNGVDANLGVVLTMALALLIVLATAHLEDLDLVMPALRKNCCLNQGTRDQRSANLKLLAFANGQYLIEGDFLPNVCRYLFYLKFLAGGNSILLTTGFYDRVHGLTSIKKFLANMPSLLY